MNLFRFRSPKLLHIAALRNVKQQREKKESCDEWIVSGACEGGILQWRPTPSKPSINPDNAGQMGLPITAGCDTARDLTRVCSDASSTERQSLRPLRHSGEMNEKWIEGSYQHDMGSQSLSTCHQNLVPQRWGRAFLHLVTRHTQHDLYSLSFILIWPALTKQIEISALWWQYLLTHASTDRWTYQRQTGKYTRDRQQDSS